MNGFPDWDRFFFDRDKFYFLSGDIPQTLYTDNNRTHIPWKCDLIVYSCSQRHNEKSSQDHYFSCHTQKLFYLFISLLTLVLCFYWALNAWSSCLSPITIVHLSFYLCHKAVFLERILTCALGYDDMWNIEIHRDFYNGLSEFNSITRSRRQNHKSFSYVDLWGEK